MSLNARINEERARLALAKERLRGRRRELGLGSSSSSSSAMSSSTASASSRVSSCATPSSAAARQRLDLSDFAANRRFEYRSPLRSSRGVSVRVSSRKSAVAAPAERGSSEALNAPPQRERPPKTPPAAHKDACDRVPEVTPRRKALHDVTAREAALAAKASLHERKLAFAERELTAQADLLETMRRKEQDQAEELRTAREEIAVLRKDKLDVLAERDVARKRVYGLSERVSSLEKKLKSTREELASRVDSSSSEATDARERAQSAERELAAARATLRQTRERLEQSETALEETEQRASTAEERARELDERCVAAEEAFSAENLGRQEYSDKCRVLQAECERLRTALEGESGSAEQHQAALRGTTEQLEAERERAAALEAELHSRVDEARRELDKARREATKALERQAKAEETAKAAEEERQKALARFQDQFQHMHEQFARTTLTTKAETDALRHEVESLRAQLADAARRATTSSAIDLSSSQTSRRNGQPLRLGHEDAQDPVEVEELLVDVDLPNGSSAELVVRSTDDPAVAIAAFSVEHELSPRVAAHLEEYVCAQLRRTPAQLPVSPACAAGSRAGGPVKAGSPPPSPPPGPPPRPVEEVKVDGGDHDGRRGKLKGASTSASVSSTGIPKAAVSTSTREPSRLRKLSQLRK